MITLFSNPMVHAGTTESQSSIGREPAAGGHLCVCVCVTYLSENDSSVLQRCGDHVRGAGETTRRTHDGLARAIDAKCDSRRTRVARAPPSSTTTTTTTRHEDDANCLCAKTAADRLVYDYCYYCYCR